MNSLNIASIVNAALAEDLGLAGDVTSELCVPADAQGRGLIFAKQAGVLCGVDCAIEALLQVDPLLEITVHATDGARLADRDPILEAQGALRSILTAERTALNFLGRLSGIATATADWMRELEGTGGQLVCTRKTTPGLRGLEKHAVRCGGANNHRFGLFDAILIKDNHIAAAGGVKAALQAAKAGRPHLMMIEIEVQSMEQLDEALAEGADVIMLDNMDSTTMAEAVRRVAGRARTEASGGVRKERLREIAATGVNAISAGWITHSAPCLDISLDLTPTE